MMTKEEDDGRPRLFPIRLVQLVPMSQRVWAIKSGLGKRGRKKKKKKNKEKKLKNNIVY